MCDYSKGKIYSIRSHLTTDVYIGSTTDTLPKRLFNHKRNYKKWLNKTTNYTSSFKLIEKDAECYIELIELYPCNSRIELCRREGEIIRNTTCVNKNIAGRTIKEWVEKNKEILSEYKKEWRQNNKEIIKEKKQQYYENNKEIITEKANQKYTCECGGKYTKMNKKRHEKSKKHQSFVNPN